MNHTAASAYSIVPLTRLAEGLPKFDPTQFRKTPLKTLYLCLIRLFLEEFIRLVVEHRDRIISEANSQTPKSIPPRSTRTRQAPRPQRHATAARQNAITAPQARAIPSISQNLTASTTIPHTPIPSPPPIARRSRNFTLPSPTIKHA